MNNEDIYGFLGFDWSENTPDLGLRRSSDGFIKRKVLQKKMPFSWEVLQGEECIGLIDPELKEQVCPTKSTELHQAGLCFRCFQKVFFRMQSFEALTSADEARLEEIPNIVYLNIFGDDLVKVGVSRVERKRTRVLEQGAHASLFIAEAGGYNARAIEHIISSKLDVIDRVQSSQKLTAMSSFSRKESAKEALESVFAKVRNILPDYLQEFVFGQPEFYYNMGLFMFERMMDFDRFTAVTKIAMGDIYTGEVEAVVGAHIYFSNERKLYCVDTSKLRGRRIRAMKESVVPVIANVKEYDSRPKIQQASLF